MAAKAFKFCQIFRNFTVISKDSLYCEYVPDIRALDTYNRDLVLHSAFTIFLTQLRGISIEEYTDISLDPNLITSSYLLLKEKRFNSVIGYAFQAVHEFFYKDNDKSDKNRYITSIHWTVGIQPNFKSQHIGRTLFEISELLLKKRFKDCNRVTFNTTINPVLYEQRGNLTPFVVPGPRTMPNEHPEKMLRKLIKEHGYTTHSEERPYVKVYPGAMIIGYDAKENLKKAGKVSEMQRYIIEQINGNNEWTLCNLAIFNLIKGNTLELTPGEYFAHHPISFEIFDYSTKEPIKLY